MILGTSANSASEAQNLRLHSAAFAASRDIISSSSSTAASIGQQQHELSFNQAGLRNMLRYTGRS